MNHYCSQDINDYDFLFMMIFSIHSCWVSEGRLVCKVLFVSSYSCCLCRKDNFPIIHHSPDHHTFATRCLVCLYHQDDTMGLVKLLIPTANPNLSRILLAFTWSWVDSSSIRGNIEFFHLIYVASYEAFHQTDRN